MASIRGGLRLPDSAKAALVVSGIAIALGGAALFGIVVHTNTPWSTQRVVGLVPLDSLARVDFVVPRTAGLKGKSPEATGVEPPRPVQLLVASPPPSSLPPTLASSSSAGESVDVPKPPESAVLARADVAAAKPAAPEVASRASETVQPETVES